MVVLEIKNLFKRFGNVVAVDELSVKIQQGTIFGILGPNGSGKSTTLSIILGIIKATSGTFSWFGQQDGELVSKKVGAIIEQPNFYPYLNAIRNLQIVAEIRDLKNNFEEETERVLRKVQLWDRRNDSFATYSYGMKRRLALAATLLGDPDVLVLDEPTNGLDPEGFALVREIILTEAKNGKTVLLASHILDEVERVCTDVLILKKGKLVTCGTVAEVLKGDDKLFVKSDDNRKLHELIVRNDFVESAEFEEDTMSVVLKKGVDVRQVSEIAMKNSIIITSLEIKNKTLEAEFLELVK